ncbi:DUF6318 family protein [Cellulomonas fimi]|uniref:DUF6318 domain-containing protein n=1 Tax=Cellulomonas fimi (strain ATCC 484 / DSM 20113 / JCM 1341 / CCUG 24087 / LMG 16345 / NBRC 15513 / NCIMB 8980 / NCTC 7547 / NRS-133) TaxID=590998 RepID=F4H554_CELFA|nr:DUF6318 family protein [Cellulomonas fimi]AEE46660.1 hypothetical protein Celf_2535 [Cellulomonas fimi ATCC 484]NNH08596.1 hypothetical protein [Cellulomonas fimi]VEH33803.1 Uncharacterised protein [Cellulomonas fimi]
MIAALPDGERPARPAALGHAGSTDAAVAVLTYWLQLLPFSQQVGDTSEARSLSHPECVFCRSMLDSIDDLIARGEHSVGGGYTISDVSVLEVAVGRWYNVSLTLVEAPSSELDQSGSTMATFPGHTYAVTAVALFEGGTWTVRELSYETLS